MATLRGIVIMYRKNQIQMWCRAKCQGTVDWIALFLSSRIGAWNKWQHL